MDPLYENESTVVDQSNSTAALPPHKSTQSSDVSSVVSESPKKHNVTTERAADRSSKPQSVPAQNSSPDENVVAVMSKARRAAASLWTVLHAQTCRVGGGRCPHYGCSETKRLLLHVKTCDASPNVKCPGSFHGCQQAKKLLAHYRRCRDIRARQSMSSGPLIGTHSCLVCSLMARHARSVLQGGYEFIDDQDINDTPPKRRRAMSESDAGSTLLRFLKNSRFTKEHTPSSTELAGANSQPHGQSFELRSVPFTTAGTMMPPPPSRPRTCSIGSIPILLNAASMVDRSFSHNNGPSASTSLQLTSFCSSAVPEPILCTVVMKEQSGLTFEGAEGSTTIHEQGNDGN